MGIQLNTTSHDEHVGEIKHYIHVVKERVRAIYNTLPFTHMPPRLVLEMAKSAVFWLNSFPHANGVSHTISPREVVTGLRIDHNKHCKYEFGEYVQTQEEHTNGMEPRTIRALALFPTGNRQGGVYFLSLLTGRVLNRTRATKLPMPDDVIDRVHHMARQQQANRGLIFGDRHQNTSVDNCWDDSDDDSDDKSYHLEDDQHDDDDDHFDDSGDDDQAPYNHPPVQQAGDIQDEDDDDQSWVPNDDHNNDDDVPLVANLDTTESSSADDEMGDEMEHDNEEDDWNDGENSGEEDQGVPAEGMGNQGVVNPQQDQGVEGRNEVEEQAQLEQRMDEQYGERSGRYGLRPCREPKYAGVPRSHLHAMVTESTTTQPSGGGETWATAQVMMDKGLKMFGSDGIASVKTKMKQLHDRKVMWPCFKKELTSQQRAEAPSYLMLLKRKRCGKIKARGCADGQKQRGKIPPEDTTSPTITTEAVFLTAMIDALENCDVAVIDILGAFMQADMDDEVILRFEGKMTELLIEVDEDLYRPYAVTERGKTVIYVDLLKALYGTLKAAHLFWEKFTATLTKLGLQINPYDACVANKTINGHQCTLAWHVDDIKASHKDPKVVDWIIETLKDEYGNEAPLTISCGKVHSYLGMQLDFRKPRKLIVDMSEYIKPILAELPAEMRRKATTPTAKHLLFNVDPNSTPIDKDRAEAFHHITMQLMYLSQCGRPDLRTAILFLSSRTSCPDEHDWKKLCRLTKYLEATIDLNLTLICDNSGVITWWVDASYVVHPNMKGHTGATMSMGTGSPYSASLKQKLVSHSSTESELIGVHDVLPQILWTSHFLNAQGYGVKRTVLKQDNKSSILLERNIQIHYFFIKDKVDAGDIEIEYRPTEDMRGDYFTKPVQGNLFTKLRSLLMNLDPSSPYGWQDQRSVLGHKPGPNPGVCLTYSEAVQKQSHQTGSSHTRSSNAVNGKVASATPDQLNTSFNL